MKISIAWVFDHIDADRKNIALDELVTKFNETTAEIEGVRTVKLDLKNLACAQVVSVHDQTINLNVPEWGTAVSMQSRPDIQTNGWYLVRKVGKGAEWATTIDLGGEKEMLLPALNITQKETSGSWRDQIETDDFIITVDNKSITHRPDMWGHRGFAREIAALFDLPLIPFETFLERKSVQAHERKFASNSSSSFSFALENPAGCSRLAGLYLSDVSYRPSFLSVVSRLSRVDGRSLNALVDLTNYVMFDISQPMHAFDAEKIPSKTVIARNAKAKEKLTLLDGQTIELMPEDMIIADASKPLSLAGIMGGRETAVSGTTKALLLESAHFDATMIRRTAQRHKLRSEASARFEKSLDPQQNIFAIQRYLKLLDDHGIAHTASGAIISLGNVMQPPVISISHAFIESRLGVKLSPDFITKTLTKLDFVVKKSVSNSDVSYTVTVPLSRATKDIAIKEDIVEEIGRFYGYSTIPLSLPYLQTMPKHNGAIINVSHIKHELSYGLSMRELYTYALFDESFLRVLAWDPGKTLSVKSPVSENWQRLVTTLMPALCKAVRDNSDGNDQLRFFEWGRVWPHAGDFAEKKVLTGILFDKNKAFSFYDAKEILQRVCAMLSLPVTYAHPQGETYPWFDVAQTAQLMHEGKSIGIFGRLNEHTAKILGEGVVYTFELDGDFLEQYRAPHKHGRAIAKYPSIERDVSMMVRLTLTVDAISHAITAVDERVVSVALRDFFQKKEWTDQKSLTFRYVIRDAHKTLTKDDADQVHARIVAALEKMGATIR